MKKVIYYFVVFMFFSISSLSGQELSVTGTGWGYKYAEGGQKVSHIQFRSIISQDKEAGRIYKSYVMNKSLSKVLAFSGGVLIGIPVGQSFSKFSYVRPKWKLAIYGGAIAGIGIIFDAQYRKKTKEALKIYNQNLTSMESIKFSIGSTENGIGFKARF